ncbi:Enoyl-CoA hydratase/carnithine racemase [Fulvimarina manganoxydans]|uniref:Enoyl-CoA hydratase/carnithine racemase n=1 Tax=Fulvimarina manganoxydans TaxID=937218 RepID=A0A1W2BN79_9HYPH|nr:enoyl-CoA hydratase [Fulvimarina manganoxydans]SMC74405.1 Enoyl-CoA hydratase/carnithine racemase [Fulvimarina manganoxydans]
MSEADLLFETRDGIGWITFNRSSSRNALTLDMYDRLEAICASLEAGGPVRCLVLTGAGDKAFAAGTDMSEFRAFARDEDALAYEAQMDRVMGAVEACSVPTIAAIAGACTGGGAAIAAACDMRLANANLRFGFPIARTLGNCLSIANLSRLVALIGAGRTKELIFTARLAGAEEARAIGLVSEILPDHSSLMARARDLAETIAGHAPLTLASTKEALRRLRLEGAGAEDRDLIVSAYMSADFREGMEAFLAKRKPQWTGR